MGAEIDWTLVQPQRKWEILRKLPGFAFWAVFSSVGSMMLGFDYGVAGTVTAFPAFQQDYGIPFPSQPSGYLIPARWQSGWSGASAGGNILGILIAGWLADVIGRKYTIGIGTVVTAAGIGVQVGSNDWAVFLAGRLINAVGFGLVFLCCPVWIGENVRPEVRGFFLCIINGSIVFGQFLLALCAYGTQQIVGHWSYMSLIVLQFAFCAVLAIGWPFYPESPYWCLKTGKTDKARKSLIRIHGSSNMALVHAELERISEEVRVSEEMKALASQGGPPILQCLQGTNLRRTLISCLPAAAQQLIGAAFVLGYITYFMSLLGVMSFFKVNVVLFIVMLLSNISAFFFIEQIGRRAILFYGMVVLTLVELLMGIMGVVNNAASLWVVIVCIFLWAIAYQLSIGAIGFALAGEVPTPRLRAATLSLMGLTQGVIGWVIGFVSPYMINPDEGNLGAKVGFVFFGLGVPLCILIWFFVPETRGLSFDDMDYLFNKRVSARHFQREIIAKRNQNSLQQHDLTGEKVADSSVKDLGDRSSGSA